MPRKKKPNSSVKIGNEQASAIILDKQERMVAETISSQKNHFKLSKMVKGIHIIRYEIIDYPASKPFYKGSITFDNGESEDASFFKFKDANVAKKIFKGAWKLSDEGTLKPWFLSYREDDGTYILCYEAFDFLLSEDYDNVFTSGDDSWKSSVRNTMKTVKYIHKRRLLHMGLSEPSNCAVIKDSKNGNVVMKILFRNSCIDDKPGVKRRSVYDFSELKRLKDWSDLRDLLKIRVLTFLGESEEKESFLAFFDKSYGGFREYEYATFVDQLLNHPYLMSTAKRMKYLMDYHHVVNVVRALRRFSAFCDAADNDEFRIYLDWPNKLSLLSPWLLYCYEKDGREKNIHYKRTSVVDLIRFLRNLCIHDKSKDYVRTYLEVNKSFPDFCNQLHRYI